MMKVLFVSSANKGKVSPIVKAQGLSLSNDVVTIDYYKLKGRGIYGYLSNIPKVNKAIKLMKPDIIHAHYSLSGFVAGLTLTRVPVVVSLMGSDIHTRGFLSKIIRIFYHYLWARTIVKSVEMKYSLSLENAIILPNGVNLHIFREIRNSELKNKFGFNANKKTILFLADPSRHVKNFALAQDAFKHIDPKICDLEVRYNIPYNLIPEILNAADIVLLTSKWEGSPNIIKEAMACNRPVVATNVGDIEWLFGSEPGHYLSSFDPNDVVAKIKTAIIFSEQVGQTKGRERIIELGLDSETIAKKLQGVYESVLQKR